MWKPISEKSVRLRLIPGEYEHPDGSVEPIGFYVSHYNSTNKKYLNCSCKWVPSAVSETEWEKKGKCLACHAIDTGQLKSLSVARKYPATVVICENFHLDPTGYDGNPLPKDKSGEQIYRKTLCLKGGDSGKCPGCIKNLQTEWGRKLIWEIPETHLEALMSIQESFGKHCGNCGHAPNMDTGEGGISLQNVLCTTCGESVLTEIGLGEDVDLSGITPSELAEFLNVDGLVCPKCSTEDPTIVDVWDCPSCHSAKKVALFDLDYWVKRNEDGFGITVTQSSVKAPDPRITANSFFLDPYELDKFYLPDSISTQAAVLQIPNPWGEETASFKDYSKK